MRINERDISSLCGSVELTHNTMCDGNYAYIKENISVEAVIPKAILEKNVRIIIFDAHTNEIFKKIDFDSKKTDLENSYFRFDFSAPDTPALLYFYFEIEAADKIYGYRGENGILKFSFILPEINFYQLTVTTKDESENINGIIYHIFVDRFNRADKKFIKENTVFIEDWGSDITEYPEDPGAFLKNNTVFGGNLYGIIEKLDYLKSLGVAIIYLSPIFESPSNHKYDTANYMKVDDSFGKDEALALLIEKAREKNIDIILDGVFNHTGADSIYFNKFKNYSSHGAYESKDSPYYNWYTFYDHPTKYESWWGIDILPRINYQSSTAQDYFLAKNGVIEKWMKLGIRGFRLDVADELPEEFIEKMREAMARFNKNALLYGEVWEDASNKIAYGKLRRYYLGKELCGVMNYPIRNGVISYIREKDENPLAYALYTVTFNMPKKIRSNAMNLLGSHDTERILTALAAKSAHGKSNKELSALKMTKEEYLTAKRRLISAYTLITALPGVPTVYYGDEAGMEGYGDPFNRKGYPWGKEDREILEHYKKCGNLRLGMPILSDGDFYILSLTKQVLIFERKSNDERLIAIYNNSDKRIKFSLSLPMIRVFDNTTTKDFMLKAEEALLLKAYAPCKIKIETCD